MGLLELHQQAPNSSGFHRYQLIYVVRDGIVSEFRRDMGLASKYKGVKYLNIPSLLEHSVDELMDIADYLRSETEIDLLDLFSLDRMNLTS